MEDAATAEICRSQLWQWLHFKAELDDGRRFTGELFDALFDEEVGLLAFLLKGNRKRPTKAKAVVAKIRRQVTKDYVVHPALSIPTGSFLPTLADAVLTGVETRTSSPIRIKRRDDAVGHLGAGTRAGRVEHVAPAAGVTMR